MKILKHLIFLLIPFTTLAQQPDYNDYNSLLRIGAPVTAEDSVYLSKIPLLEVPEGYEFRDLPAVHDNSAQPYFRPIISQEMFPNCMQASSIAYNFTYEMCRAREVPADMPENQYTTHFTWNFLNGGNGWFGVNYLHTHEVIRTCGTPSVADYGGIYEGGGKRWMSGYEEYYNAMHNRIEGVYAIPVGTPDGLNILKHWLYEHLEGSHVGGVANFIACSPWNLRSLPEGTPEAGKKVIPQFCPEALHGMTIVGWNDSIRYDYNEDGLYTNDVDINEDGVIDMKDWEIGGVRFANSYDVTWADSGFSYMMYKTLADVPADGGVWSNVVHVVKVKEDYEPLLALKVNLYYGYRGRLKVSAGVSNKPGLDYPEIIMDFPIFNYQGAGWPMQGCDSTDECRFIEFGLDVTPLLSHIESGQDASFFLIVDEKDPYGQEYGEIVDFSLMDYTNGNIEHPYPQSNIPLINNTSTILKIPVSIVFDKPEIITTELPAYQGSQNYEAQLEASGGEEPYTWKVRKKYSLNNDVEDFPSIDAIQYSPNANGDSIFEVPLNFSFPFFGDYHDTIRLNLKGYIFLQDKITHWSYMKQESYFFQHIKAIAPFKCNLLKVYPLKDDGLWGEVTDDYAAFRWHISVEGESISVLEYAVKLFPDGNIRFYYNGIEYEGDYDWVVGLSNGDKVDYHILDMVDPRYFPEGSVREFVYQSFPDQVEISDDGLLTASAVDLSRIYDIEVVVTDQRNISDFKSFQFSSGPVLDYHVHSNGDTTITGGQEVSIDALLKNISQQQLTNVYVTIDSDDPYVTILDDTESLGTVPSGQTINRVNAFQVNTGVNAPDNHIIILDGQVTSDQGSWEKSMHVRVKSALPAFVSAQVEDGNNNFLDPGEAGELHVTVTNLGRAGASQVTARLTSLSGFVEVENSNNFYFGNINPGEIRTGAFDVRADWAAEHGQRALFTVEVIMGAGVISLDTFDIIIGRTPVLVLDLDEGHNSAPMIVQTLEEMDVNYEIELGVPTDFSRYQSVFVCTGIHFSNHVLEEREGRDLANFLKAGGNIWMEGRETWRDEPQTEVHGMFGLEVINQSTVVLFEVIRGMDSTFAEGMVFENGAQYPVNFFYLEPVAPAYVLFESQADQYPCGIAYDAGTYKTIGTIFEFGALVDDTSTRVELMEEVLDFFDITFSVLGTDEIDASLPVATSKSYPNPFSGRTEIMFVLTEESNVTLDIFNLSGQRIQNLIPGTSMDEGTHRVSWDVSQSGVSIPAGVYFYRLVVNRQVVTGKLVVVRGS